MEDVPENPFGMRNVGQSRPGRQVRAAGTAPAVAARGPGNRPGARRDAPLDGPLCVYTLDCMDRRPDTIETTACLCLAARRAAREITRAFDRGLRGHGLRATQFTLLSALDLAGPQAIGELADLLGTERTTLTRNLARVEEHGLVAIRAGRDARARIASLTPRGRRVLRRALPAWRSVQEELVASIGAGSAASLRRLAGGPCVIGLAPRRRSRTKGMAMSG